MIALALMLAGCATPTSDATRSGVVARIGDGDTLDLDGGERVRLVQIDAPEIGEGECYAGQSRLELGRLSPPGTQIGLEADGALDAVDRHGRLLRYVTTADVNVNVELVRRGAATPYFFRGDRGRYAADLLAALDDARSERRGMWASCRVTWSPERPVTTRPR